MGNKSSSAKKSQYTHTDAVTDKKEAWWTRPHVCMGSQHCCRCDCIKSVNEWNLIEQIERDFLPCYEWKENCCWTQLHENNLLHILNQYNVHFILQIIKDYLKNAIGYNVYCHVNLLKKHNLEFCWEWFGRWDNHISVKIRLIGDKNVGKRSLHKLWLKTKPKGDNRLHDISLSHNRKWIVTNFHYNNNFQIINGRITNNLDDEAECNDVVRWLNGPCCHILFLCFSFDSKLSLEFIKKCLREIKMNIVERIGIILVGCKVDLKYKDVSDVDMCDVVDIIKEYNIPYVETSCVLNVNIEILFRVALYEWWVQYNSNSIQWC